VTPGVPETVRAGMVLAPKLSLQPTCVRLTGPCDPQFVTLPLDTVYTAMAMSVSEPACEVMVMEPVAGITALNHTSPPATGVPQLGAGTVYKAAMAVALSVVNVVLLHVVGTGNA